VKKALTRNNGVLADDPPEARRMSDNLRKLGVPEPEIAYYVHQASSGGKIRPDPKPYEVTYDRFSAA